MLVGAKRGWGLLLVVSLAHGQTAWADPAPVTMTGVPPQIIPSYAEVGAPTFVTPSGGGSFMGDTNIGSTGGSSGSTDWTGYTSGSGSPAMDMMMATSYGSLAAASATQAGVVPEAMADLGQLESGFKNVGTSNGSSSATGPWQITTGTWADTVAKYNLPYTASDITNPAAQATVASYIAKDYSSAVSEETGQPATVVQTYGAWVFGPSPGANIAVANTSDPLSKYVSATALSNNNMTGWTVGQFNSHVTGKLGSSASTIVQSS